MKIIVCYKIVPTDQGIAVNADRSLKFVPGEVELSPFDMNAIEAGVQLAAAVGDSKVVGVTVNDAVVENTKVRKAALSRGLAEGYAVKGEGLGQADATVTAAVLKAAIEKIGDCDMIICGEGSGDLYNQQVGNLLGVMMGLPVVNGISKITAEDGKVVVERTVDSGVDVLEVKGPAVLSVTSDINIPRIPTMRDILGAGKKPFAIWDVADVAAVPDAKTEIISVAAPEQTERKKILADGSTADGLQEFWSNIGKLL